MAFTVDKADELHRRLQDFDALLTQLTDDVVHAAVAARDSNGLTQRRNYVRAVLTFVEGTLAASLRFFHDSHELESAVVLGWAMPTERLHQIARHLDLPSAPPGKPRLLSVEAQIRVIVELAGLLLGPPRMQLSGKEWTDFRSAVALRNRVMHPKRSLDLRITDADVRMVDRSRDWYRFGMQDIFLQVRDAHRALVSKYRSGQIRAT